MSGMSASDFDLVREVVRDGSAIAINEDKLYLVESRLKKLVQREKMGSVSEVVAGLRGAANDALRKKVVEVMTTNETSFYRDAHVFESLRSDVFPRLEAECKGPMHIWCAASSSGQEPYTLLIELSEHFPTLLSRTSLLATDLSEKMVESTRSGLYSQMEVNRGLPTPLMMTYFSKKGLKWEVNPAVRKKLTAKQMNLAAPWPSMPSMHVILMRNVLIYFDMDTKKQILSKVKRNLQPGGLLVLGGAETTLTIDDDFRRVKHGQSHFYQLT